MTGTGDFDRIAELWHRDGILSPATATRLIAGYLARL
jgi:hypothetical protein